MSVYRKPGGKVWLYDFKFKRRRFHGSTGQVSRRAAETVERQIRLEAATGGQGQIARLTLDFAAGRYWTEVGASRGDAVDVERRIARLLDIMGKATPLGEIDQAAVARAIETRRGQTRSRSPKDGASVYFPSNATVNRDIVETLRPILKRARSHWTEGGDRHGLPEIDWRALRLREPRAQSRLYTAAEREAWIKACPAEVRLALEILLTYGLRLSELFFPLDAFNPDPDGPTLTLQKGRKRDVFLHIPLRRDHGRELAALAGQAKAQKLDHVWFTRQGKRLVSLTYYELEGRLSRAADAAGVTGARRIHGARHHAGSTILARTGNLKAVQALLGHASISSSQRYAHVLAADLRAALEDPAPPQTEAKPARRQRKAR